MRLSPRGWPAFRASSSPGAPSKPSPPRAGGNRAPPTWGDSGTEGILGQGQRERGAFQVRSGGGLDGSSVQATPEWVRGTWRSRSQGDSVRERGSGPPQRPEGRTFYCGLPPKGATFQIPHLFLCLRPPKGVAESVSL